MFGALNWENIDNKFIGKTNCGTYIAEIYSNDSGKDWYYYIYRNGEKIYPKRDVKPNQSFENAKETVETLVSLNYIQI